MASAVDELAKYGLSEQNAINMSADEYAKQAAAYRKALQQRLIDQGQEQFQKANPFILEDLNSRGFATSPSETANTQARYLSDIALKNNQALSAFDTDVFGQEQDLRHQAAMTPLELERMGIERDYALSDQARQDALARELASQQSKDSMTSGLLGLGGNLLQGAMISKAIGGGTGGGGFLSGLFGAGGGAAGGNSALAGSGAGAGSMAGSLPSLGQAGLAAGIMAASLYGTQKLGNSIFKSKSAEKRARTGAAIGGVLGPMGMLAGMGIGGLTKSHFAGQISKQSKNLISQPVKTVVNAPKAVAKTVQKAFKKAFCFTPGTMIEMADGSLRPIEAITLGETINGGQVHSIRMSLTEPGQIYNYLGTNVTGTHAVKENGIWTRVENSAYGIQTDLPGPVISLVTENHRIHSNGNEFADEFEHDDYEDMTMDESLKLLNFKEFAHA